MTKTIKLVPEGQDQIRLKTTITVWVLYASEFFKCHMVKQLSRCYSIHFECLQQSSTMLDNISRLAIPDVIFVETGGDWARRVTELQNIDVNKEREEDELDTLLIVFGDESDNLSLRVALKLGATDFISQQAVLEDFAGMLHSIAEDKLATRHLSEVYLFLNTKGGSGATTVALNTAVEVAMQHTDRVLLLDLDIHFGVVMDYLNINPAYSLNDVIANLADLDEVSLRSQVTRHNSGLHILSFKHENHQENFDNAMMLGKLIPILREHYDYIFVDLSLGIDHIFIPILSQATKIFLITQQNLVSIKNTSRIAKALTFEYGVAKEQLILVVNRYEKRQQIKLKDIEETIAGLEIHTIPNDFKSAIESVNLGTPLVSSKKGSAISKSVARFTRTLMPKDKEQKSWFKRLFS
ncbi:AAA family ATPase [Vibrio quintilis]|uniref:Septum site-determining protein MinD n=1 Tax=Vibrio quintilis TaxID=1117707 RepID=A0A1M7YSB8_9VIBR|nr:AAA family ATPase [Vibrio quintilis]SHO55475.1 Septum site-determining protein MinD [Vibrio quintilis]